MNDSRQNSRNGILSLTIKDKAVLYSAYMPFLSNGGLFVPTNKAYDIGDEVFMLLTLMDEPEKIPVGYPPGRPGQPHRGYRCAVQ
jgi:type IV pilus assembly protein PilZ